MSDWRGFNDCFFFLERKDKRIQQNNFLPFFRGFVARRLFFLSIFRCFSVYTGGVKGLLFFLITGLKDPAIIILRVFYW